MLTPELLKAFERLTANWYASPAAGLSSWITTDDKSAQDTASLLFALLEPTSKPFPRREYVAYSLLFDLSVMQPWNQLILNRPSEQTIELNPNITAQDLETLFSIQRKHSNAIASIVGSTS